jgi:hypothetical protein
MSPNSKRNKSKLMPYKFKSKAGRYVPGQSSYDPILDIRYWNRESIDLKNGGLKDSALETLFKHSNRRPQYLTKIGKDWGEPLEEQLFPDLGN